MLLLLFPARPRNWDPVAMATGVSASDVTAGAVEEEEGLGGGLVGVRLLPEPDEDCC